MGPAHALSGLVLGLVLSTGAGAAGGDDVLSRAGSAAWAALEGALGPQPLRAVSEFLSSSLWAISCGLSAALGALCGILGELLAAAGVSGPPSLLASAPAPPSVQRALLWALAALALSGLRSLLRARLQPLLGPALRCAFLCAFLLVAGSAQSPTAQAGQLLALWALSCALQALLGPPPERDPDPRLQAALRSLEWKVEELQRRQRWGGPRNREE
ncbi:voltage-gated monoatomic cation channel TMEM109 [Neopsephotus bourkii]|uniref:voltage-gated monoatomic cation channel TMEM109 n=1 Tax=Neopsephotus bourkii TaxID=309878 RepID=UPI002AA5734A|nr:voltage-gated monoatomic cation channel TMEM109 [Neopsephotus bourkii]